MCVWLCVWVCGGEVDVECGVGGEYSRRLPRVTRWPPLPRGWVRGLSAPSPDLSLPGEAVAPKRRHSVRIGLAKGKRGAEVVRMLE